MTFAFLLSTGLGLSFCTAWFVAFGVLLRPLLFIGAKMCPICKMPSSINLSFSGEDVMLSNRFGDLHDAQMEEGYSSEGFTPGDLADLASGSVRACARPFGPGPNGPGDAGSLVIGVFCLCSSAGICFGSN